MKRAENRRWPSFTVPRRATSSDADKRQIGTGRLWAPTGWSEGGLEWAGRPVSGPGSSVSRWWPVRHCTLQSSVSRTYSALVAATVAGLGHWLQRLPIGHSAWLATDPKWQGRVQAGAPAGLVPLWDRSGTGLRCCCTGPHAVGALAPFSGIQLVDRTNQLTWGGVVRRPRKRCCSGENVSDG